MASTDFELSSVLWKKSSYSNGSGGDCVEVADGLPGVVPVRDSKWAGENPVVFFRAPVWAAFVGELRQLP